MGSQIIQYSYQGDELAWRTAIETFLSHIAKDPVLKDTFSYHVFVQDDGIGRVHLPVWQSDEIVAHLTSQPFFKAFSTAVKSFAGDSLNIIKPTLASD